MAQRGDTMRNHDSKDETRSPLKKPSLRLPGQSAEDERGRLVDDVLLPYILFPAVFWIIAFVEWIESAQHLPPQPWPFAASAVISTIVAAVQIRRLWPKVRDLRLGRDGERVVGEVLEELRGNGVRVFHDIPADGFNLDHVLVMRRGVFVIETKTWSKRGRNPKISARTGRLYKDGFPVDPNPLDQARAEADWLRDMLKDCTAKTFPVQAVVLFPGWMVDEDADAETKAKAWALNPTRLRYFLKKAPIKLDEADVALVADRIALHVRNAGRA